MTRRPTHRRVAPKSRTPAPPATDMDRLLATATYTPSAEHKGRGHAMRVQARLRTDATECPRDLTVAQALEWVRDALRDGDTGGPWPHGSFPKFLWRRVGGQVFEARLSNQELGWYHGYPISDAEAPGWLQ